jgi:hypothetical protein
LVFNDIIPPPDNGYGYYVEARGAKSFFNFLKR